MRITTNLLRGHAKRLGITAVACSAILFTCGFLAYSPVKAALSSAETPEAAPLSDSSVAALVALDHSVEAVAARVTPAMVNIAVTSRAPEQADGDDGQGDSGQGNPMEQFRRFFGPGFGQGWNFGPQQQQQRPIEHGIGSGIIVSPDGYIVTNDHVVNGAMQIRVTLHDRRTFPAKVIGTDKLTDLAVVKINATNLPWLSWGDSSKLQPGQTVLAFGSPFGVFQFSVTRGIVSAVDRPNPDSTDASKPGGFIQTDAAINPGNSGGPLVDAHGEVIGINTFLISDSGSFAGAGFAIPSQIARVVSQNIIKNGKMEHGYLGIGITDVTPDNAKFFDLKTTSGAVVTQVTPDSPASRAGLKVGDVITSLNGQPITTASDLQVDVGDTAPGTAVTLDIMRSGASQEIHLTLGQLHDNQLQAGNNNNGNASGGARLGMSVGAITSDVRQQLNLPANTEGVVVEQVQPGSQAEDAGISRGDVIISVDRQPVTSPEQFRDEVDKQPAGQDVLLLVWANGGASYLVVHTSPNSGND